MPDRGGVGPFGTSDPRPAGDRPAIAPNGDRPCKFVGAAWTLLVVNTLGYTEGGLLPFPKPVAQILTMGALGAAFMIALLCNPRVRLRPNAYLLLLSLVVVVSLASSLRLDAGYGALLRCARLILFAATLWLLSVWWRGDLRFAFFHVRALAGIVLVVALGLVVAPQSAFGGPDGRLVGALWPIPATQVGLYCAVVAGMVVLLWMARRLDGVSTLVIFVPAVALLLLSHTRTALLALTVGVLVAGLSMWSSERRVRRFLVGLVVPAALVPLLFGAQIQSWLERGQDSTQLANLTGRTKVWDQLLAADRTPAEQVFGIGLTDKSYAGLPIDNAWLAVYQDQGWAGLVLVASILLCMLVALILRPPSAQRSLALFLVTYCLAASYTEVGLGDASPYLLLLAVAASLIAVPNRHRSGTLWNGRPTLPRSHRVDTGPREVHVHGAQNLQ